MRGLTAEEYELLRTCASPEAIALSLSKLEPLSQLQRRGLVECGEDVRWLMRYTATPLGREAMRIHEAIAAMVST